MSNPQYHYSCVVNIKDDPIIADPESVRSDFRVNQFSCMFERLFSEFFEF
jgi:hypothetical protein